MALGQHSYEVKYAILSEERLDSGSYTYRTDQQYTVQVSSASSSQAQSMVEAQNGGRKMCQIQSILILD